MKLGLSTGILWKTIPDLGSRVEQILKLQNDALELGIHTLESLKDIDSNFYENVKKFKYRSVHAPVDNIHYPCPEPDLKSLLNLVESVEAHTIVFHPDIVDDFSWLVEKFGSLTAFENMDKVKLFGQSAEDMENVFREAPEAKFVFDLNHLYSVDGNMSRAEAFHEKFGTRLCHYHISGYDGYHTFLCSTRQSDIPSSIKDLSVPLIHEGVLKVGEDIEFMLTKERDYISSNLT